MHRGLRGPDGQLDAWVGFDALNVGWPMTPGWKAVIWLLS